MRKLLWLWILLGVLGAGLVTVLIIGPGKVVGKLRSLFGGGPPAPTPGTTANAAATFAQGTTSANAGAAAHGASAVSANKSAAPAKPEPPLRAASQVASGLSQAAATAVFGPVGGQVMGGINNILGQIGGALNLW